ncbi:hypothetical protein ACE1BS_19785 [Aeromonas jandaei]
MNKKHPTPLGPKVPTLLPVEYCSPERAARMLGCDVDDIFHWAAIGAIKLYAIFDFFQVRFVNEDSSGGMLNISANPWENKDYTSIQRAGISSVFNYSSSVLKYGAELRIYSQSKFLGYEHIEISGLWEISQACISKVDYRHSIENELSWSISASYLEEYEGRSIKCIEIFDVEIEDIEQRIRIVWNDLSTLNKHITTGEKMNVAPNRFGARRDTESPDEITNAGLNKPRVTAHQATAIVELLASLGYTEKELKGSVEALQKKITLSSHSKKLSTITEKTFREWLERAGARS